MIEQFVWSLNEFIFAGWLLGILEAWLVKKVAIDKKFAAFNLILVSIFWFATELFIHIEPAKSWIGDSIQFIVFMVLGYGAYKIFQKLMSAGTGKVISEIGTYFKTTKKEDGVEVTSEVTKTTTVKEPEPKP
ncbi:MAG: hypothetical protein UZ05_CHB002000248 [Chlorobi bacterium OLB5]|nr:MAG: hypothetical protein UZ05_CHB002000248 [Chlorobi bacterium OLB5]